MPERTRIFISYAHEDIEAARRLYHELLQLGVEPWLDKECILPGQHWERAIETAIRDSHYIIIILSARIAKKRGYIQKEIRLTLDALDRIPESQVFLIPVKLDNTAPPHPRLQELQWVDMYTSWDEGFAKIRRVLDFARQAGAGELLTPSELAVSGTSRTTGSSDFLDLTDTTWSGTDSDGDHYTWEFLPGAVVRFRSPNGEYGDARWTQNGTHIYWEMNDKYSQYSGEISGGRLKGTARNIAEKKWSWDLERVINVRHPDNTAGTTGSSDFLDLTNTTWSGTDSDGDHYTWEFLPGAVVRFRSPNGEHGDARWTQNGTHIYWEMNDKYSQYSGEISGGRLKGTARNIAEKKWSWDLGRINSE